MTETHADPVALAQELARFPLFSGLPLADLQLLDARRPSEPMRPGMTIFRQGDVTPWVYLIRRGEVELVHTEPGKPRLRRIVREGQVLGRLELDAKEGQLGTAKTLTQVELIAVSLESLARLRARFPEMESRFDRSDVIGQLRANPYLAPLDDLEIKWISDIVEVERADKGIILLEKGVKVLDLVIMRQGRVRLEGDSDTRWVSAGAVFGYRDILAQTPSRFKAVVESPTRYFLLPEEDFRTIIARHRGHDWTKPPFAVESLLRRVSIFEKLAPETIHRMAGYVMQIHLHRPHHTIVSMGQETRYCYILARGSALRQSMLESGQTISATIGPGAYFGVESLLYRQRSDSTVETLEPTDWVRFHHEDFLLFLNDNPGVENQLQLTKEQRRELAAIKKLESWQFADERVLFKSRRHWIVLLKRLWILLPFILVQLALSGVFAVLIGRWPPMWLEILVGALYILPIGGWIAIDYSNDFHIVTTKRVVHREKVPLIRDSSLTAPINQIQNLDIHRGLIGQILRYGDLIISTAAPEGEINFDHLPNPSLAHKIVSREMQRIQNFASASDLESRQKELQKRLHIGLEEKIDDRALLESPPQQARKTPPNLPFLHLLGLQEKENHRLVWRRHWIGLVRITVPALLVFLLSGGALILIATSAIMGGWPSAVRIPLMMIAGVFLLASMFWFWWNWEDWENDRYIVTDQIVERIQKKPLWMDEIRTTIRLERIQNVQFTRPTPLAYLLHYGDVDIQTAAQEGKITFNYVPAPDEVQFEILNRLENYQRHVERRRMESQKKEMLEWLEAYHKLTTQEQHPPG